MEEIYYLRNGSSLRNATYSVFPSSTDAPFHNETGANATELSGIPRPTYPTIDEDGAINNIYVQAVFTVIYGAIFIVGITGNILVCFVVCRNRAMHTVTNFFITNLALSDIMLCAIAVPFTPLYTFMKRWVFGSVMCHVLACAQAVSVYISSLTLTSIAVDRFIVIVYPFQPRMRVSTCISVIASCWVSSILLTIPYDLYVHMTTEEKTGHSYCEENWPSEQYRKWFGTITMVLQFVAPFIIISFCYIYVSFKLNARARSKPGSKSAKKEEADRERKKRTNRMLISMVAVFGVSWLPLSTINVVNDYYEIKGGLNMTMFFVFHCLAMASTCYNPFLYAWLNENFRKEFRQILPFFNRTNEYNGVGGIGYGSRGRSDRLNSQADGNSVITRASEIIPRGPTCNSSIKKVLRDAPVSFTATTDVLTSTAELENTPPNGTAATKILPTGLLETQFDVLTSVVPTQPN